MYVRGRRWQATLEGEYPRLGIAMRCAMTHVEVDAHAPLALQPAAVTSVTARVTRDHCARTKHTETFFEEEVLDAHRWLDMNATSPLLRPLRQRYYKPSSAVFPARIPTWRQKNTPRVLLQRLEECVRAGTIVPKSDGTYQVMPVVKRRRSCESSPDVGAYVPLDNYCTQSDDERHYVSDDRPAMQEPRAEGDVPPSTVGGDCDVLVDQLDAELNTKDVPVEVHVTTHEFQIQLPLLEQPEQDEDVTCVVGAYDVSSVHTSQLLERPLYEDISDAEEEVCVETTTDIQIENDKNLSQDTTFQWPRSESQICEQSEGVVVCKASSDSVAASASASAVSPAVGRVREAEGGPLVLRPRRGSAPELSHTFKPMRCQQKTQRSVSLSTQDTMAHSCSDATPGGEYHNKLTLSRMRDRTWRIKTASERTEEGARRGSATEKTVKAHVVAMIIGNLDSTDEATGLAGEQCVEINITECETTDDQTENINYIIEAPETIRVLAKTNEKNCAPDFVINGVPFRTSEVGERATDEGQVPIVLQYCHDNELSASGVRRLSESKTYDVEAPVGSLNVDSSLVGMNEEQANADASHSRLVEHNRVDSARKSVSEVDPQSAPDSKQACKHKALRLSTLRTARSCDDEYSNANTVRRYVEQLASFEEQSSADASRREKRSKSAVHEPTRETEHLQSNELRRKRHSLDEQSKSNILRRGKLSNYVSKIHDSRNRRPPKYEHKLQVSQSGKTSENESLKLQKPRRGRPPKGELKLQVSRSGNSSEMKGVKLQECRRGRSPKGESKFQESPSGKSSESRLVKLQESKRGRPPKDLSKLQESRRDRHTEQSKLQDSRRSRPAESEQPRLQQSQRDQLSKEVDEQNLTNMHSSRRGRRPKKIQSSRPTGESACVTQSGDDHIMPSNVDDIHRNIVLNATEVIENIRSVIGYANNTSKPGSEIQLCEKKTKVKSRKRNSSFERVENELDATSPANKKIKYQTCKETEKVDVEKKGKASNTTTPERNKSKKNRFSRRNFRHDSIQTFKVTPNSVPPPWRYKGRVVRSPDITSAPVTTKSSSHAPREDEIADSDSHSPNDLIIDLNSSPTCSEAVPYRDPTITRVSEPPADQKRKLSAVINDEVGARVVHATDSSGRRPSTGSLTESLESPTALDEEGNKRHRKKEDVPLLKEVNARFATTQMQKNGRRLAQEIPGFNWLEEKIRNGGVPTIMPPKKTAPVGDRDTAGNYSSLTQGDPARETSESEEQPGRGPVIVSPQGRPLLPLEARSSILAQQLQLSRSLDDELRIIEMHRGDLIALRKIQEGCQRAQQIPDNSRQTGGKSMPPSGHHGYPRSHVASSDSTNSHHPGYTMSNSNVESSHHSSRQVAPYPYYSPDTWDFSNQVATMARHTATCFDTGLGVGGPQYGPAPSANNTHTRQQPWLQTTGGDSWMERGHPMRPTPHYAGYQYNPFNRHEVNPPTGHVHKPHFNRGPPTAAGYKHNSEVLAQSNRNASISRVQVSSQLDADGDSDSVGLEELENMKLATRKRLEQVEQDHIAATRDLMKIQESRIVDPSNDQSVRARPAVPSATAAATGSNSYDASVSTQAPNPWGVAATLRSYLSKQTSPTIGNVSSVHQRHQHAPEISRMQKPPGDGDHQLQSKQLSLAQQQEDKRKFDTINAQSCNNTNNLQFGTSQPRIQIEEKQRTNNLPSSIDAQSSNLHTLRMNIPPETEIMIRNCADAQPLSPYELNRRDQTAAMLEADRQYFNAGKRDSNIQTRAHNSHLLLQSQLPQGLELMLVQDQQTSHPPPMMQNRSGTSLQFVDHPNQRTVRQTQHNNYSDQRDESTMRLQHQGPFTNNSVSSTSVARSYQGSNVNNADLISDFEKYRHLENARIDAMQMHRFQEAQKQASLIREAARIHHQEQVRRDMHISLSTQRLGRQEAYGRNVAGTSPASPLRHLCQETQHRGIMKQDPRQKESISSSVEARRWSHEKQGRKDFMQPARKLQRLGYEDMALAPAAIHGYSEQVVRDTTMPPVETGRMSYRHRQEIASQLEGENMNNSYYTRLNHHFPQRGLIPIAIERTLQQGYRTNDFPIHKEEMGRFQDVASEKCMASKETERLLVEDIMRRGSVEISVGPQGQINQEIGNVNKLTSVKSRCKQAAHPSDNQQKGKLTKRAINSEHQLTTIESRSLEEVHRRSNKTNTDSQRLPQNDIERGTILMNHIPDTRVSNVSAPVEHTTTAPVLLKTNCTRTLERSFDAQPYQARRISTELNQASKEGSQDRILKGVDQGDITSASVQGQKPTHIPDNSNTLKETETLQQNTNIAEEHLELLQQSGTPNKKEPPKKQPSLQPKENKHLAQSKSAHNTNTTTNQEPSQEGNIKGFPQSQNTLESRSCIAYPSVVTAHDTSALAKPSHTLVTHSATKVDVSDELPMDLSMKKCKVSEESLNQLQNKIHRDPYEQTQVTTVSSMPSRAMQVAGEDCEINACEVLEPQEVEKVNNREESIDRLASMTAPVVPADNTVLIMADRPMMTETHNAESEVPNVAEQAHVLGNSILSDQESSKMMSKITNRLPIRSVEERILKRHSSKEHAWKYMTAELSKRSETEANQVTENKTGDIVEDGLVTSDISTAGISLHDCARFPSTEKESEPFELKDNTVLEAKIRSDKLAITNVVNNFQNVVEEPKQKGNNKTSTNEETQSMDNVSTTQSELQQKHSTTIIHGDTGIMCSNNIVNVGQSGLQLVDASGDITPLEIPPIVKVSQSGSQLIDGLELNDVGITHSEQVSKKMSLKELKPKDSTNITYVDNTSKCSSKIDEYSKEIQCEETTPKGAITTSICKGIVPLQECTENALEVHNTHMEIITSSMESTLINQVSPNIDSTKKCMLELNGSAKNTPAVENTSKEVVKSTNLERMSQLNESTKSSLVVFDNIHKEVVEQTKEISLCIASTKNSPAVEETFNEVVASTKESISTNNTPAVKETFNEVVASTKESISTNNTPAVKETFNEVLVVARTKARISTNNTPAVKETFNEVVASTKASISTNNTPAVKETYNEVVASTKKNVSQLDSSTQISPVVEETCNKVGACYGEDMSQLDISTNNSTTVEITYNEEIAGSKESMSLLDASTKNIPGLEKSNDVVASTKGRMSQINPSTKNTPAAEKACNEVVVSSKDSMSQLRASTKNTPAVEKTCTEVAGTMGCMSTARDVSTNNSPVVEKTCRKVITSASASVSGSVLQLKETNKNSSHIPQKKTEKNTPHVDTESPEVVHLGTCEGTSQVMPFSKITLLLEDACKDEVRGRVWKEMSQLKKNHPAVDIPKIPINTNAIKEISKLTECCKEMPPVDEPMVNVHSSSQGLHLNGQSTNILTDDMIHREMFRSRDPRLQEYHSLDQHQQNCRFEASRPGNESISQQHSTNKPSALHEEQLNHSWHAFRNTHLQLGGTTYFNKATQNFNEHTQFDRMNNLAHVQDISNNQARGMLNTQSNQILPPSYPNRMNHDPPLNEWQNVPQINPHTYGQSQKTFYGNNQRQIIKLGNEVALQRNRQEQTQNHAYGALSSYAMNRQTSPTNSPGSIPMGNLNLEAKAVCMESDRPVVQTNRTNHDTTFVAPAPARHYTAVDQPFNSTGNYLHRHSQDHIVPRQTLMYASEGTTHHLVRHHADKQRKTPEQNTHMKYTMPDTVVESGARQPPMLATQTVPTFILPGGATKTNQPNSIASHLPTPNHGGYRGFVNAGEPNVGSAAVTAHIRRYATSQISPVAANSPDKEAAYPVERLICRCSNCNKEAQFLCSACQSQSYCSQNCQILMWDQHARECQRLRQLLLQ